MVGSARWGDGGSPAVFVLEEVPDWETAPIRVICAPVSGTLTTRTDPWYRYREDSSHTIKISASQRLIRAERTRRWRIKNKK